MSRRTISTTAAAALLLTLFAVLAACDTGEPTSAPGVDSAREAPLRSENDAYTQYYVGQAIATYESDGLDATLQYYNTQESVDGQWYVFIYDGNDVALAHAANPALVGRPASEAVGPNGYPAGEAVMAVADEAGSWFSYSFPNPETGAYETKHSWMVRHDGLLFGSGWYEPGTPKHDPPAFTQSFVRQAIALYDAVGRDGAVEYYNSEESVDGQWYVFIVGEDGRTIAHFNPTFIGRDPDERIDAVGYFYGDDLLGAEQSGRWISYVLTNPEQDTERRKHTWAVRHDGLIFASGWYE